MISDGSHLRQHSILSLGEIGIDLYDPVGLHNYYGSNEEYAPFAR